MANSPGITPPHKPQTSPRQDREDPAWDYGNPFEISQGAEAVETSESVGTYGSKNPAQVNP
jgi:hypothetical protein